MPARRTIGVDMGGTKLLAGAVDSRLGVHHRVQRPTAGLDLPKLLTTTVDAVQETIAGAGGEVDAVGFGIPALIDRRRGRAMAGSDALLSDVPFADLMAERLGLPVFVENDANAAALAEHRAGAAKGVSEAIMLTIGTAIGGGLILRGELYRGAVGAAGELGHMVIQADGPRCSGNCPNRGCVDALASGAALTRHAEQVAAGARGSRLGRAHAEGRRLTGALVSELAHDGDAASVDVLHVIGTRLGVAIANYANIFNPQVVVIGGGVIGAGELLLGPARAEVARRALPPSRDGVRIVAAKLGVEAGMVGAAAMAREEMTLKGNAGT